MDDPSVSFGVVPVRPVGDSTLSAASFDVAGGWLSQCLAADPPQATNVGLKHVKSNQFSECFDDVFPLEVDDFSALDFAGLERPTRLLEIGVGVESGLVRLTEDNKEEVPYATLSYCWGKSSQTKQFEWLTTQKNVHSRRTGMRGSELPQTLQDSITVAERLGFKHIWIDSLCIIQDSDDDWAVEAANMGEIYRGSVLTIVAASSNSAESGCFNQRSVSTMQTLRAHRELMSIHSSFRDGRICKLHVITRVPWGYRFSKYTGKYTGVPQGSGEDIEDLYKIQVKKGPWINRAWTLQEHIFSRRMIFYTDTMLLWECDHCRLSEDRHPQMQGDRLYPLDLMGSSAQRGYSVTGDVDPDYGREVALTLETWYCGLVEDYTNRQLTFRRDKLVAIGALARATSQRRSLKYLAGLRGDSVFYGLLWRRDGPGSKSTTYTCPSWSWASQKSPVSYEILTGYYWFREGPDYHRVLDVHVEPSDMRNPFGDVKFGYLLLQTKVQTGRVLPDFLGLKPPNFESKRIDARGLFIDTETAISHWPVTAYMDDEDMKYGQVLIAVIGMRHQPLALLLHPPCLGAEAYRRVGLAHFHFDSYEVGGKFNEVLEKHITK